TTGASGGCAMALASLSLLDKHKAAPFSPGYPDNARTFYSPIDDVPQALLDLLKSANKSLIIAMYGYDDPQLNQAIQTQLSANHVYVQMSLDSIQAAGAAEQKILATWQNYQVGNSIAIGHSEKNDIMHLKMVIIDGIDVVTGSTNWSSGGESRQDNQMTVIRDPVVAAEARARLDIIHDEMLKQMAAKAAAKTKASTDGQTLPPPPAPAASPAPT